MKYVYIVTCVAPDSAAFTKHRATQNAHLAIELACEYAYGANWRSQSNLRKRDQFARALRGGRDVFVDNGPYARSLRQALCERLTVE